MTAAMPRYKAIGARVQIQPERCRNSAPFPKGEGCSPQEFRQMMATDQGQRTRDQGQRTKRKYTVSDKVRAANRINLGKAHSVDKKVRYRLTDKRLAANRASLRKALQARRYKRYARDWVRAVDLRKSAVQAGETPEEYDRHLELVEQVLPAEGERQRNGVRGLGQALWRRRRLFGNRAQGELFSFYLELEEAAVEGLSLDSVQDLRCETCYVFLEGEHPRLEETMERLDKRLVRVTEAYLTELAEELVRLEVWGKHCYRADLLDQPPEVIGNGLVRRREVKRRMQKQQGRGKHTSLLALLPEAKETKSHLLKVFVEAGHRLPDPRREQDFTLHLRLIEAAFFGDRDARFGLETGKWKLETGKGNGAPVSNFPFPVSSLEYRVARVKRLQPELYQAVRNLAEATWERLQVFARQGKKSLKQLWWEGRDRRLAQNPGDAIYRLLWAKFLVALKKAKAERRKAEARKRRAEARKQKPEVRSQESEAGSESKIGDSKFKIEEPRNPNPEPRVPNPGSGQSSSDNHQSAIPGPRSPNPEPRVPNPDSEQSSTENRQSSILGLQWKVERLIGVF